jgi:hypothetical protein
MARIRTGASLVGLFLLLASLVGLFLLLPGCGGNVTDCYEMRQVEGTRSSNGEFCLCTFFYPAPNPPSSNPVGPPCNRDCRDRNGVKVADCNATPPF